MANYIAVNSQAEAQTNEYFANSLFKNVQTFVEFYNSGLVNRKAPEILKSVEQVVSTYKDVKEAGSQLVFISQNEVQLDEINRVFNEWTLLVKLRRDLNKLLSEEELSKDDTVYFIPEAVGFITRMNEDGGFEKLNPGKLYSKHETMEDYFERYSTRKEEASLEEKVYAFAVSDFTDLDDSFITKVYEIMPK